LFCGECGSQNKDTSNFCWNCGKPLKKTLITSTLQPVPAGYPQTPPAVVAVPAIRSKTEKLVLFSSIICGIASFFIIPYILAGAAIILGIFPLLKKDRLGITGIAIGVIAILIDYGFVHLLSYCPDCIP
jgi:hypothetical protein